MDFSKLSGPIIGAIIGYGTNWLAIKMLFRPLKPIKIVKWTLPFTPGIIPRRKSSLAKAIGDSIGNNLFTSEDIQKMFLSEKIKSEVIKSVVSISESEDIFKDVIINMIEDDYFEYRENIKLAISGKIKNGLINANVGEIIANEGKIIIKDKVKSSMLRMFVSDNLIDSITEPIGIEIEKYIKEHGNEKIIPIVENEIDKIENMKLKEIFYKINLDQERLNAVIDKVYMSFIQDHMSNLLEKMDIAKVVEEKINDMDVLELEKLIMSIMKKELGAIVNLGAVIGLVLGTLNIFI